MNITKPSVTPITCTPSALEVIELAGRACYKSESHITADSSAPFIRSIIKSGHESVLEHASVTFRITTDRGISHEIVRHRIASYSQESSRYCNYAKKGGVTFIDYHSHVEKLIAIWLRACEQCEQNYNDMLAAGATPEEARRVLLLGTKTELVMTANFREWRHFMKLRTARAAHPDCRFIASLIYYWFRSNYPVIVEDITPHT